MPRKISRRSRFVEQVVSHYKEIFDSGGVRKLRWGVTGRGKRGGIRVIYCARVRRGQIWMLTLYAKNVVANIPANVLRQIKEEIDG